MLPSAGGTPTLQFGADGSASGTDGCNRFSTSFTQEGNSLTFGPVASTMMACAEPSMTQAAEFQTALAGVTGFQQTGIQLMLFAGDQIVMTFVADVQSLDGTMWTVTLFNNGMQAAVGLQAGTEILLTFDATDLYGNAGCNNYFGAYTVSGTNIAVGTLGSTMRLCETPAGVMEQEQQYLAALQSAATFRIENDELWLRTAEDAIAVVATKAEEVDLPAPEPATPTGRVSGTNVLNIRSGPGTNFAVVATAREGDEGTIIGRSADGGWWAVAAPQLPGGVGWASAQFVAATNVNNVPVIASPPTPIPPTPAPPTPVPATPIPPTPTPPPAAQIAFWANRTTINAGECATLFWDVNNVQGVWVYPQGSDFNRFPRVGQGNEQVCPGSTTTYEMRVQLRDNSTQFRTVTINVIQPIAPPVPPIISDPLAGTRWTVVNINNGSDAVVTLLEGTNISLDFGVNQAGQVSGRGGCNTFFANYFAGDSVISVSQLGSTSLMCTDPAGVMEQEQQFFTALQSATSFQINGNQLELRGANGIAVVATR